MPRTPTQLIDSSGKVRIPKVMAQGGGKKPREAAAQPLIASGPFEGPAAATLELSLDELLAGGVEVTAPEPFRATLRLSARPAAG